MTDQTTNERTVADMLDELGRCKPVDLLTSLIAAHGALRAVMTLQERGLTEDNAKALVKEIRGGLQLIEIVAERKGMTLPDVDSAMERYVPQRTRH